MLRAFVDESYSDDVFFMAAAISRDHVIERVTTDLDALMADLEFGWDIPRDTELHGYELFQGRGPWAAIPIRDRLDIAGRAFSVVADNEISFIIRSLDRAAQRDRYRDVYEPYPMVLTHIMRELHKHAGSQREQITVVCDEIHQHDRHRAMLERHRLQGTPGYNSSKLGSIVDQLEFVRSVDSRMVQVVDMVAYLRHRRETRPDAGRRERRAQDSLWRIVQDQVIHDFCWVP